MTFLHYLSDFFLTASSSCCIPGCSQLISEKWPLRMSHTCIHAHLSKHLSQPHSGLHYNSLAVLITHPVNCLSRTCSNLIVAVIFINFQKSLDSNDGDEATNDDPEMSALHSTKTRGKFGYIQMFCKKALLHGIKLDGQGKTLAP